MAANDTQVGGTHYHTKGDKIQHWDLAVMFQWDPFQYQITKYVMRWKDKHATHAERIEDLKKARHFLDKYIEEAAAYDSRMTVTESVQYSKASTKQAATAEAEHLLAQGHFTEEGYFGDMTQEYKCVHCRAMVRATSLAEAYRAHSTCALAVGTPGLHPN